MSKLTIMRGLPASGKSTKAEELLGVGNTVRINKDLIREMLHFNKFNGKNEGLTKNAAYFLADHFLDAGINVIIDDTNLNPKTLQGWKDVAKVHEAKVEVVNIDTNVEQCVYRDLERAEKGGRYVGGTVIKNMALQYNITNRSPYVLCDIDGTIADIKHRLQYARGENKDWKKFFSLISQDTVRVEVRKMLIDYYNKGFTVIFVSARPEDYKEETLQWLEDNGVGFAWTVIMRRSNDKRQDTEVKKDILDMYFPDKSKIHAIIDDRPSIIRMWREQGLNVIDVGEGIEF